jgi:uncharacterized protein (TIGR02147 family)
MVSVFSYSNYREYLRDYFSERKKSDPSFSHRWLAGRLGLATSNFMLLVIQGKRNMSQSVCMRLSDTLRHTRKEAEYFEAMVGFCQAKSVHEKQQFYARMRVLRGKLKIKRIEEKQYEYYESWYNPVIRELVAEPGLASSPDNLAKVLLPAITSAQARRSVELLVELGFVRKRGATYEQCDPIIATDREVNSFAVAGFHKAMGTLAVEAVDRVPKHERNFTASTIRISAGTFDRIRRRIEDLRKELLALAQADDSGDRVYQLNFQVFPVTRTVPAREKGQ